MSQWAEGIAPGGAEPVQRSPRALSDGDSGGAGWNFQASWSGLGGGDAVHRTAAAGVAGGGGPLPHGDAIQRSFGAEHDVSGIQAHVGGQAGQAAQQLGAAGYASGNHVAFREQPGLHLAAHEAAHVVQQRAGVQLSGGVGAAGDAYEQNADAVAERVVKGESAADLLKQGGAAGGGAAVQRAPGGAVQLDGGTPGGGAAAPTPGPAVPQPAGGAAPGGPGGPPGACATPAEQAQKDAFRRRTDLHVDNYIPSTGIGKFDAKYFPSAGLMPVTVKIHFNFVQADNTPGFMERLRRRLRGQDVSRFFWSDGEKTQYQTDFVNRVQARWSNQHTMRATKPCWTEFFAIPTVTPVPVDNAAGAHFNVTVHKSSGPGIDYKSAVNNEHLLNPAAQPTADFWQSDNREEPNFNSGSVATTERQRIEGALASAAASPVLFAQDKDDLTPAAQGAISTFGAALNQANPSAPMVPIHITGFASAEGQGPHNQGLSERRAQKVTAVLRGLSVRQPLNTTGRGAIGAPNDAANRKVDITVDHAFETTYASNRYSVSEHEFGHMLGNPDEYSNAAPGTPLGNVQTAYNGLVTSAGLNVPTFGQNTSSQMSAGVDVLPRHYVTLWEALGRMTTPSLNQNEWSLQ